MEAYWLSLPISDEHDGNNAEDWPRFHSKGRFTNTDLYYNYRYNGKLYYIMGVAFYFRMNYEVLSSISTILKSVNIVSSNRYSRHRHPKTIYKIC